MSSQALRNIPKAKLDLALSSINSKEKLSTQERVMAKKAIHRYYEANIPVKYWSLEMNAHWKGDKSLLEYYKTLISDLKGLYKDGTSVCFAGSFGLGKTMVSTNILKRAVEHEFDALYVSLNDIFSAIRSNDPYGVRRELLTTDFLVVDEFDPRHIASTESAVDFYGRIIEDIIRNRSQNKLPLFLCTNSPNVLESFSGVLKQSITSLMNYVEVKPVLGKDFRVEENKNA